MRDKCKGFNKVGILVYLTKYASIDQRNFSTLITNFKYNNNNIIIIIILFYFLLLEIICDVIVIQLLFMFFFHWDFNFEPTHIIY